VEAGERGRRGSRIARDVDRERRKAVRPREPLEGLLGTHLERALGPLGHHGERKIDATLDDSAVVEREHPVVPCLDQVRHAQHRLPVRPALELVDPLAREVRDLVDIKFGGRSKGGEQIPEPVRDSFERIRAGQRIVAPEVYRAGVLAMHFDAENVVEAVFADSTYSASIFRSAGESGE
jgi:hypothetical protein